MSEKPVIDPNPQTLPDILASLPDDTPIVMLNLLRFNETARYKDCLLYTSPSPRDRG